MILSEKIMPKNFVIRFAVLLFMTLLVIALGIHFMLSKEVTVVAWILMFPIIMAVPILASVLMSKDEELEISMH